MIGFVYNYPVCCYKYQSCVVHTGPVITNPPQDEMVCVGDEVNITCGYTFIVPLVPVWLINGRTFSVVDIRDSDLYNSPVVANRTDTVLTVTSITGTMNGTTFQCEFTVQPTLLSSIGTLTVYGKILTASSYAYKKCWTFVYRSPSTCSCQGGGKESDLTGNIMGHIQPYLMW